MSAAKVELSQESVRRLKEGIAAYAGSLRQRCDELCRRLSAIGVEAAVAHAKVDTGELASGISFRRVGGADYLVVSEGPYAAFVEFGTGVVGAGSYDGGLPEGWQYDARRTPEAHDTDDPSRWYYYDEDGRLRSTRGQRASSYMAKAAEDMRQRVLSVAKEVFSFDGR